MVANRNNRTTGGQIPVYGKPETLESKSGAGSVPTNVPERSSTVRVRRVIEYPVWACLASADRGLPGSARQPTATHPQS